VLARRCAGLLCIALGALVCRTWPADSLSVVGTVAAGLVAFGVCLIAGRWE